MLFFRHEGTVLTFVLVQQELHAMVMLRPIKLASCQNEIPRRTTKKKIESLSKSASFLSYFCRRVVHNRYQLSPSCTFRRTRGDTSLVKRALSDSTHKIFVMPAKRSFHIQIRQKFQSFFATTYPTKSATLLGLFLAAESYNINRQNIIHHDDEPSNTRQPTSANAAVAARPLCSCGRSEDMGGCDFSIHLCSITS